MKTLADFKRALVVGSRWHCFHELHSSNYGDREVVFRDSVKVGFKATEGVLIGKISYLYFPKANLVEFHGDEVRIFYPADAMYDLPIRHVLTYSLVNEWAEVEA